ncbi:hypothetical protein DFJ74DRAFT_771605 [Hyaloraphidium curvatum]|nr:hypothetical protein DFJ74DRAFT_771605 [Hyaloraphidium curvatum]
MRARWAAWRLVRAARLAAVPRAAAAALFAGAAAASCLREKRFRDVLWVCALLAGLALLAAGLTRRPAFGLFVGGAVPAGLLAASAAKARHAGHPLLPYDVVYLGPEAAVVLLDYPIVLLGALVSLGFAILAGAWLWLADAPLDGTALPGGDGDAGDPWSPLLPAPGGSPGSASPGWTTPLGTPLRTVSGSPGSPGPPSLPQPAGRRPQHPLLSWILSHPALCSSILGLSLLSLSLAELTVWKPPRRTDSVWTDMTGTFTLSNFVFLFQSVRPSLPPRSSAEEARKMFGHTLVDESRIPPPKERYPDVYLVMEESTFDPWTLLACNVTSLCLWPGMFHADASSLATGVLRSPVIASGTWIAEFATHAGLLPEDFGAAGGYAPFSLAPRMTRSLAGFFRSRGYRTVAIYPGSRRLLNTDRAYKAYGFDHFYDSLMLKLGHWYGHADRKILDAALRLTQPHLDDGRPLFVYAMTIRNHGPHDTALPRLPPPWNAPLFPWAGERDATALQNYLRRLNDSLVALEAFKRQVAARNRTAVVAAYGDHRPAFAAVGAGKARLGATLDPSRYEAHVGGALQAWNGMMMEKRATWYKFASIPSPAAIRTASNAGVPPVMDLAYLGWALARAAGVPPDSFLASQGELARLCGGKMAGCDAGTKARWYAWVLDVLKVLE